jgi:hypothetical protein
MVENRLKADTGAGGLYEDNLWQYGPFYSIYATPSALDRPYCVFSISQEIDQSQSSDGAMVELTFTYYANKTATDGTTQPSVAMDRIFGDAILQPGRVPTYGFHRALLTLPANGYDAEADACQWLSTRVEMIDEEVISYTSVYKFGISAQAATP